MSARCLTATGRPRAGPAARSGCASRTSGAWPPAASCGPVTLEAFVRLEVLYFDGCPGHEALMPRLRMLMAQVGVDAPVELRRVESVEAAERERFVGSPTLRVDGQDVDPSAGERTDFGLKCRLYPSPDGLCGTVPDEFVIAALTRARAARDAPVS